MNSTSLQSFSKLSCVCLAILPLLFHCGRRRDSDNDTPTPTDKRLTELNCEAGDVRTINRPFVPGKPELGSFLYRAQVKLPATQLDPLVVFIPGGPGQRWMGIESEAEYYNKALPTGWGYMFTDPRGVGCNSVKPPDNAFYSSLFVAEDILALVKEIGVSNYILYGVSYGTVVAQIAASRAEGVGMASPNAVVHEGTVDRMFGPDYLVRYREMWEEAKSRMPGNLRERFKQGNYPLGKSARDWTLFLRGLLVARLVEVDGRFLDVLHRVFKKLGSGSKADEEDVRKLFDRVVGSEESADTPPNNYEFYLNIACSEIWQEMRGVILHQDKLLDGGINACADIAKTSTPYDSAKWKTSSPIYYFQGKKDPATPYEQAKNHFENQVSNRVFVTVARGGHNPLRMTMRSCQQHVWKAVNGNLKMEKALSDCQVPGLFVESANVSNNRSLATINEDRDEYYADVLREFGSASHLDLNLLEAPVNARMLEY